MLFPRKARTLAGMGRPLGNRGRLSPIRAGLLIMQASSKSVSCPTCGLPATITLSERIDPVRHTEGHAIALSCQSNHDRPDEPALLKLWAAVHRVGA